MNFNNNNLLIGVDAIGLGGHLCPSPATSTHYNPAGLTLATVNSTASTNTFAWE